MVGEQGASQTSQRLLAHNTISFFTSLFGYLSTVDNKAGQTFRPQRRYGDNTACWHCRALPMPKMCFERNAQTLSLCASSLTHDLSLRCKHAHPKAQLDGLIEVAGSHAPQRA